MEKRGWGYRVRELAGRFESASPCPKPRHHDRLGDNKQTVKAKEGMALLLTSYEGVISSVNDGIDCPCSPDSAALIHVHEVDGNCLPRLVCAVKGRSPSSIHATC